MLVTGDQSRTVVARLPRRANQSCAFGLKCGQALPARPSGRPPVLVHGDRQGDDQPAADEARRPQLIVTVARAGYRI